MAEYRCYCTISDSGLLVILSFATISSYHGIYYLYETLERCKFCESMYVFMHSVFMIAYVNYVICTEQPILNLSTVE